MAHEILRENDDGEREIVVVGDRQKLYEGDWIQIPVDSAAHSEKAYGMSGRFHINFDTRVARQYVGEEIWVEVDEGRGGYTIVHPLPIYELYGNDETCGLPKPRRDEPVRWDGTPQELDKTGRNPKEVFDEEDIRGSKNDLL